MYLGLSLPLYLFVFRLLPLFLILLFLCSCTHASYGRLFQIQFWFILMCLSILLCIFFLVIELDVIYILYDFSRLTGISFYHFQWSIRDLIPFQPPPYSISEYDLLKYFLYIHWPHQLLFQFLLQPSKISNKLTGWGSLIFTLFLLIPLCFF